MQVYHSFVLTASIKKVIIRSKSFRKDEMNDEIMYMTIQLSDAGIPVIWYVVTQEDCLQYIKQSNERRKIIVIPVEAQPDGRL